MPFAYADFETELAALHLLLDERDGGPPAIGEIYDQLRPHVSKYLAELQALPLDDPNHKILEDRANLAKMIWLRGAIDAGDACDAGDDIDGEDLFKQMETGIIESEG